MKYSKYILLSKKLRAPIGLANKLKDALTHESYYKNQKVKKNGNSRLVFLGMFQFRGVLAEYLENFIPATGQQLQHLLGNLISNKRLSAIFDDLQLHCYIRKGENFDLEKHKHIFVFGLLGFLVKYNEKEQVINFIKNHLIKPSDLENFFKIKYDKLAQMHMLYQQKYGIKPVIKTLKTGEGLYNTQVLLDNKVISEKISKSKIYSRKAAIKKALQIIVNENYTELMQNEDYQKHLKEKLDIKAEYIKKMKKEKHELLLLEQKRKKQEREERKKILKQKQEEREKRKIQTKKRKKHAWVV